MENHIFGHHVNYNMIFWLSCVLVSIYWETPRDLSIFYFYQFPIVP